MKVQGNSYMKEKKTLRKEIYVRIYDKKLVDKYEEVKNSKREKVTDNDFAQELIKLGLSVLTSSKEGLENFAGCAVVVSHDRWFLDRIATHILAFEGDSKVTFYEGSYSEYEEFKRNRDGYTEPQRIRYRKLMD